MLFLRRQALAVATFLVALAVIVNFARSAPIVLDSAAGEAATAYVADEALENDATDAGPKCPCPTEIEKTDCDEGLCNFGLTSASASLESSSAFSHDTLGLETWRSAGLAPEPHPPRIEV